MSIRLYHGECERVLSKLDADSTDACVTDPPYGLKFMGKKWDAGVPTVAQWTEVLRVLKPGAHLLAFGGTRTSHRLVCAIEDAGFEIRDQLAWIFGSGFPKSHNLEGEHEGWGTALKPAHEPIVLARKPLEGTVAENMAKYGTGALNIDACRVGSTKSVPASPRGPQDRIFGAYGAQDGSESGHDPSIGRWPANVLHDGSGEVIAAFPNSINGGRLTPGNNVKESSGWGGHSYADRVKSTFERDDGSAARFFYCAKASREDREDGLSHMPQKVGVRFGQAKNNGSGGLKNGDGEPLPTRNSHPTVKPTDLMRYLCRLITPHSAPS